VNHKAEARRASRDLEATLILKHYAPDGACKRCGRGVDIHTFELRATTATARKFKRDNPNLAGAALYRVLREFGYPPHFEIACRSGCEFRADFEDKMAEEAVML
jgi:hypothetical protein